MHQIKTTSENSLLRLGGLAALTEGLIYIAMFTYYGAFFDFPASGTLEQKVGFLAENQVGIMVMNLIGYVLFGTLLAVLVMALHSRRMLKNYQNQNLFNLATAFGVLWVGIVISGGMIANLSLNSVIELSVSEPEQMRAVWLANNIVVEGLAGGIEFVGGMWVLLLSIGLLRNQDLSPLLNYLGIFVGLVGIATVYPATVLTEIFGVSQIIWFFWLGTSLIRTSAQKEISPKT